MRYFLVIVLATVLVFGGCSDDTDPVECNRGEYDDSFTIETQSDVATLARIIPDVAD